MIDTHELNRLRAANAMLLEENRQLRATLAIEQSIADVSHFAPLGLTITQTRLLALLMARKIVSRPAAMEAIYGDADDAPENHIVCVMICHIRKRLARYGVAVETRYKLGWSIPPEGKERLRVAIEPRSMAA